MQNQNSWKMASCYALLFFFITFFFGVDARTITLLNNCPTTIWPAVLSTGGSLHSQLSTTGFQLPSGTFQLLNISTPWIGRIWARTRCSTDNDGRLICLTGDCNSGEVSCREVGVVPATLAEFSLTSNGGNGQDFYDLSLVDGFNLPVSITPQNITNGGQRCRSSKCLINMNDICPVELQLRMLEREVIGCKSACSTFNQSIYCCTGEFNNPGKCMPTNYSQFFKRQCPDAYSYAYDDGSSTFTCNGQPNYVITFCEKNDMLSVCSPPIRLLIPKFHVLF